MEIVANGHDLAIFHDSPNLNVNNNHEVNEQIRERHRNGNMQIHGYGTARHEKVVMTINSWQKVLFPCILIILHAIIRSLVATVTLWRRLKRKIISTCSARKLWSARAHLWSVLWPGWCSIVDEVRNSSLEVNTKQGCMKLRYMADSHLLKKPSHVAFAILEGNKFSYQDIANLIAWSIVMGINNISLYDLDGILKGQKTYLRCEAYKRIPLKLKESCTFLWLSLCSEAGNKNDNDDFHNYSINTILHFKIFGKIMSCPLSCPLERTSPFIDRP